MISDNIQKIKSTLPDGVRLIAVSKTKPVEMLQEAYDAGQRLFGENYATELRDKHAVMPQDIEWHFIGHLQPKQLKYYIGFVSMIHGVDSVEHLEAVEHAAAKVGRTVNVLLQFHIAQEETKFGFTLDEVAQLESLPQMEHVRVCGVMGMASLTADMQQVRSEFRNLKRIFDELKASVFAGNPEFRELSMGMSGDYQIAIEEGATLVRIGSSIFGARVYNR
ncbi:MAG: YggS family pyridoxal phosphate-dependent enzyme [Bacteroidales bacterium]|nr:YggS family pyridoxal phosphate-dependent enzyme [Bacteroidales bacterium]